VPPAVFQDVIRTGSPRLHPAPPNPGDNRPTIERAPRWKRAFFRQILPPQVDRIFLTDIQHNIFSNVLNSSSEQRNTERVYAGTAIARRFIVRKVTWPYRVPLCFLVPFHPHTSMAFAGLSPTGFPESGDQALKTKTRTPRPYRLQGTP
jgi:hypothetical protein